MKMNQKIPSIYSSAVRVLRRRRMSTQQYNQTGQALLVVILVMVVALTVGLSIAVRSMTNIRISGEDESSQRAFSAAEAGIERTLANSSPIAETTLTNNTKYSTTLSTVEGLNFLINNGTTVLKDEPVDIWLSTYPNYTSPWTGTLTISWGLPGETCTTSETTNTQAALEIVIISTTSPALPKTNNKVTSYLLDPCILRRGSNNSLSPATPGSTFSGITLAYKHTISVTSGLIARVIPLYAPTVVGAEGSVALPPQGTVVSSTGISENTQRKIISYRAYPKLPIELFPFILFSPK